MNNMSLGFYIDLCSTQSDNAFPDNTNSSFRISLPKNISLFPEEGWCVALVDMKLPQLANDYKTDFIRIEMLECQTSVDCTQIRPTLFKAYNFETDRGQHICPNPLRYVGLMSSKLNILHFNLTGSSGAAISFAPGSVYCTLHVIKA